MVIFALKRQIECQNATPNWIEMVCEMASEDSDWSASFTPPDWNDIRTTKGVTYLHRGVIILVLEKGFTYTQCGNH
jgi:hypothetical protein